MNCIADVQLYWIMPKKSSFKHAADSSNRNSFQSALDAGWKRASIAVGLLFSLWVVFCLLLSFAQILPHDIIEEHIAESRGNSSFANVFNYSNQICGSSVSYDNNRFIIYMAEQETFDSPLETAARASIVAILPDGTSNPVEYFFYWHGWQVLTNLILLFPNSMLVLKGLLFLLATGSLVLLFIRLRKYASVIASVGFILIAYLSTGLYFNFIGDLLLSLSTSVVTLLCCFILKLGWLPSSHKRYILCLACMGTGAIYNWIDFLSVPAFSFGLVLFCSLLAYKEGRSTKELIIAFFLFGLSALAGFAFTWVAKWVVVCFFLPADSVFGPVIQETFVWSARTEVPIIAEWPALYAFSPRIYAIWMTFKCMLEFNGHINQASCVAVAITLACILGYLAIYAIAQKRAGLHTMRKHAAKMSPVTLLPALLPVFYCVIMPVHAITHIWLFSAKPWAITLAILVFFFSERIIGTLRLLDTRKTRQGRN